MFLTTFNAPPQTVHDHGGFRNMRSKTISEEMLPAEAPHEDLILPHCHRVLLNVPLPHVLVCICSTVPVYTIPIYFFI